MLVKNKLDPAGNLLANMEPVNVKETFGNLAFWSKIIKQNFVFNFIKLENIEKIINFNQIKISKYCNEK
jgi:hypothetical protein